VSEEKGRHRRQSGAKMTRLRDPFAASFGRNFPYRRLWTNIQHFFLPSLFPDASQLPNRLGECYVRKLIMKQSQFDSR
jgi:hypothetical protein